MNQNQIAVQSPSTARGVFDPKTGLPPSIKRPMRSEVVIVLNGGVIESRREYSMSRQDRSTTGSR